MAGSDASDADWRPQSLVRQAINKPRSLIERPVQVATSRPAIKAYLSALLFVTTSVLLLSISSVAYFYFYYNYIPQINLEKTVYLQYGKSKHPYGTAPLQMNGLISQQPYDVSVLLHMPRTPLNLEAGNFMVDLTLYRESQSLDSSLDSLSLPNGTAVYPIDHSRRPTILPYSSKVPKLASTLMHLPFHLLSLHDLDSTVLTVRMFEQVTFARGRSKVPTHALLEIQTQVSPERHETTSPHLQIYSSKVLFEARFHGLRYLIYNHRILAFCVFSSAFYLFSVTSMAIAWLFISNALSASNTERVKQKFKQDPSVKVESGTGTGPLSSIKQEDQSQDAQQSKENIPSPSSSEIDPLASFSLSNLSDTPTTFPTIGRNAPPLQYTPQTSSTATSSHDLPPPQDSTMAGAEPEVAADDEEDEEDDEDEFQQYARMRERILRQQEIARDSGIGTSLESEGNTRGRDAAGLVRRRSGRSNENMKGGE